MKSKMSFTIEKKAVIETTDTKCPIEITPSETYPGSIHITCDSNIIHVPSENIEDFIEAIKTMVK